MEGKTISQKVHLSKVLYKIKILSKISFADKKMKSKILDKIEIRIRMKNMRSSFLIRRLHQIYLIV